ncbi:NAD(P)/FAD-dependent oxidoreductase [Oscillospiraceae bacterium PP1C4]
MFDVAIIGCGIVGAAAAYELSRYQLDVAVFEAANDVADATTKANSAIIHAGYDPEPDTLMAKLNVEGSLLAKELCHKLDVPYKQIGSLVLAFTEDELSRLQALYLRGKRNGVPHIALLDAAQVRAIEQNLSEHVVGALYAPTAAIVSPWEYALALAETAVTNGVKLHLNSAVTAIRAISGGYELTAKSGVYQAKTILNAAGIHAAQVHNLIAAPAFSIVPNRGEYYLLDKSEGTRVNHVIFQCPTSQGKGVLVSPTIHGNLIVGPNAQDVTGEDVATTAGGLSYVGEMAKKSVPSVNLRESIRNFAGVRALADTDDFIIKEAEDAKGFIDLAGIKSPGLSAAPAIAKLAVELLKNCGISCIPKQSFADERRRIRFKELSVAEKTALIQKNSAYGRVICRCETITEGEILDAIHAPIPPRSVDAVKRRCNAGMGRCQGGFCGPRVLEILSRELGCDPTEILQDKAGTVILTGETKAGGAAHV